MKQSARLSVIGSALAWSALLPASTQAGGIQLYEIATPDVGLASAGYAARAQDASVVFRNPAGMSLLPGTQFQGGLQLTYGDVEFSPDGTTTVSGGNGGNAVGALPAASLFFTHALSERWSVGFGSLSYFGLMETLDDGWVGRYYVQKGGLLALSAMPTVSFKATDWLRLGAGLNAMYGYLNSEVAVKAPLGQPDGLMELNDETWGFGANVGVLVEPRPGTRLGLSYLSPVELDFQDTPTFSGLPRGLSALLDSPPQLDLGITVPQSVMFSLHQELSPKWAIFANVGWQNWHQFGKVDVGVDAADPTSLTKSLNFQDTWHGALGAQYRAGEDWLLTAGFAYDGSAVEDEDRTLSLPMGEAYRMGLGAQWQLSQTLQLGAAYEFMWGGDMSVTQESAYRGRVSGAFADSWFSFFTLNAVWRF